MPRTSTFAVAAVAALALSSGVALAAEAEQPHRSLKQGAPAGGGEALGSALFEGFTGALPIDALGDLAGAFEPVFTGVFVSACSLTHRGRPQRTDTRSRAPPSTPSSHPSTSSSTRPSGSPRCREPGRAFRRPSVDF